MNEPLPAAPPLRLPLFQQLRRLRRQLAPTLADGLLSLGLLALIIWAALQVLGWAIGRADWAVLQLNSMLLLVGRYPPDQQWRLWLLGGLLAVVGVLAVQAGWQWWGSNARDLASASPPASSASVALSVPPPVSPSVSPSVSPPVPPSVPPSVSSSVPSADPALAPAPAPIPLTGPAPAPVPASAMQAPAQSAGSADRAVVPPVASAGRLQISAKGDRCWIEILHDQGRTARVLQPGQVIDLPAVGLHKVFVGNVRAITATLNGQPLDLRPTGGVTARYDAP